MTPQQLREMPLWNLVEHYADLQWRDGTANGISLQRKIKEVESILRERIAELEKEGAKP